jgi:hypothetical protein
MCVLHHTFCSILVKMPSLSDAFSIFQVISIKLELQKEEAKVMMPGCERHRYCIYMLNSKQF